jgi:predicted nucleic acid-binding protein
MANVWRMKTATDDDSSGHELSDWPRGSRIIAGAERGSMAGHRRTARRERAGVDGISERAVGADEIALVESVIEGNLIPFEQRTAVLAAQLFNQAGRRRGSRFDCLIAATAILANAELATENKNDFTPFVPIGLKLI